MKIWVPSHERRDHNVYVAYLSRGFRDAYGDSAQMVITPEQPTRPHSMMAVDIEQGGVRRRVWWDWSDFSVIDPDLPDPCGKIELLKKDLSLGIQATSQITLPGLLDMLYTVRDEPMPAPEWDVYCVVRSTNYEDRVAVVQMIRAQEHWHAYATLAQTTNRPTVPPEILGKKFPPEENYRNQRHAKICVAPRGIGEKTWRHMETLALGSCLVMNETDCVWPADYTGCCVVVKRDWSDLVEKIDYLLEHEDERAAIARAGMEYWDRHLSPKALARRLTALAFGESA